MVVISICLMLVALTGCIGAVKESTMLVNVVSNQRIPRGFRISFQFITLIYLVCSFAVYRLQHGTDCRNHGLYYAWSSRDDVDSHDERIVPTVPG